MREIKFRFWNKEEKVMSDNSFPMLAVDGNTLGFAEDSIYEVMQYTGLKDKNGKEIYEGDIVGYWGEATWEVLWNDKKGAFRFGNRTTDFPITEVSRKEVIGNVHENPELLK